MRKLSFGVANSLDNRIARPDDSADWLLWSDEVSEFMKTFFKNVDTILMGRKTYEVSKAMDGGPEQPGVSTYVFSRTIKDEPGVQVVSEDAAEFVRDLKQQEGKDICCMGGGELACALLEADLIDEILLNVHPLLLGQGTPLFLELSRQIDLELVDCHRMEHDCVSLTYRVKR